MAIDGARLSDRWKQLKSERKSKPQRLRILAVEFSRSQKEIQRELLVLDLWYDSNIRKEAARADPIKKAAPPERKKSSDYNEQQAMQIGERYLRGWWRIYKDEGYFQNFADDEAASKNQERVKRLAAAYEKAMAVELGLSKSEFKVLLSNVEADRAALSEPLTG